MNEWLPCLCVAMVRPFGALLLMPVFSSTALGGTLHRNALALVLAMPALQFFTQIALPDPRTLPWAFAGLLAGEFVAGVLIGFSAAIPLWAMEMSGSVLDTMRGATMAGVFNPLLGAESSPLGTLFSQLAAVLFLVLGGLEAFVTAVFQSYLLLPPGESWHWHTHFQPFLAKEWHTLFSLTLGFAMPGMVVMVLIDLTMGFLNRAAPNMNVFSLSMPIKSLLTMLLLIVGLQFGLGALLNRMHHFNGGLVHLLLATAA